MPDAARPPGKEDRPSALADRFVVPRELSKEGSDVLDVKPRSMWSIDSRVIVYAAIGAALYGVLARLQVAGPRHEQRVSARPAFALVPFFGYAFGPIVGFFTGFVGNAIGDQISRLGPPDVLELEHRQRPRRAHRRASPRCSWPG